MKVICSKCEGESEVDIVAIARDISKHMKVLGRLLGTQPDHLLTEVTCKHCGTKIPVKSGGR